MKKFKKTAMAVMLAGTGVLATSLANAALPSRATVLDTVNRVANYYTKNNPNPSNGTWTGGTLQIGILAAYHATGTLSYLDYSMADATNLKWAIGNASSDANNFAIGQAYLDMSSTTSDLAALVSRTNAAIAASDTTAWTWIDAIHMQMNDFTELGNRLGNTEYDYHGFMFKMFDYAKTTLALYDTTDHLWYRDASHPHVSPNGKKVFWSRGNGWVFVSLARTLETLPPTDANYATYRQTCSDMAAALVTWQRSDGFWNADLDDANDPQGENNFETSGTAAFAYGLAAGLRMGVLKGTQFEPALEKAWTALTTTSIQSTGALGYCQGVGFSPSSMPTTAAEVKAFSSSSSDFCVGLVLRAGSEISRIAPTPPPDLALNKAVTYSSQQTGNEATHLVDGNTTSTRWSAQGYPQWVQVDLGGPTSITRAEVSPYASRAYQYKIEGSADGTTYAPMVDRSTNIAGGTTLIDVIASSSPVRYVRLTVTGATAYSNQGDWVSINELVLRP